MVAFSVPEKILREQESGRTVEEKVGNVPEIQKMVEM